MSPEYGPAEPDIAFTPAKIGSGARFLLCSDRLSDLLDDDSLATIMLAHKDPKKAADDLVEIAKKNGGHDNITVAVIDVAPESAAVKVIKNKVVCGCIAAVLAAGLGIGGYTLLKPDNEAVDIFEDIDAELQAVEDAENFKEALDAIVLTKDSYGNAINEFKTYSGTVDESNGNVKAKNDELKTSIETAQTKFDTFADAITAIETDEASDDVEKMDKIKELASSENTVHKELKDAISECSNKKSAVDTAIETSRTTPEPAEQNKPEKTEKSEKKPMPTKKSGGNSTPKPAEKTDTPAKPATQATQKPAPVKSAPPATAKPATPKQDPPASQNNTQNNGQGGSNNTGGRGGVN